MAVGEIRQQIVGITHRFGKSGEWQSSTDYQHLADDRVCYCQAADRVWHSAIDGSRTAPLAYLEYLTSTRNTFMGANVKTIDQPL